MRLSFSSLGLRVLPLLFSDESLWFVLFRLSTPAPSSTLPDEPMPPSRAVGEPSGGPADIMDVDITGEFSVWGGNGVGGCCASWGNLKESYGKNAASAESGCM